MRDQGEMQDWLELCGEFSDLREVVKLAMTGCNDMAITRIAKTLETTFRRALIKEGIRPKDNWTLSILTQETKKILPLDRRLLSHIETVRSFRNPAVHTAVEFTASDVRSTLVSLLEVLSSGTISALMPERSVISKRFLDRLLNRQQRFGSDGPQRVQYYDNVGRIYEKLHEVIRTERERTGHACVKNLGLDLETVWPELRDTYLSHPEERDLQLQLLIIDPDEGIFEELTDEQISTDIARTTIRRYQKFMTRHGDELQDRRIRVEMVKNRSLPILHGFDVNGRHLFFSYCHFSDDQTLEGGNWFYHYCRADTEDPIVSYYFKVYNDWFDYWWRLGAHV